MNRCIAGICTAALEPGPRSLQVGTVDRRLGPVERRIEPAELLFGQRIGAAALFELAQPPVIGALELFERAHQLGDQRLGVADAHAGRGLAFKSACQFSHV